MYKIAYSSRHNYASAAAGIEVPIELRIGNEETRLMAKIDTGASFCIFQREHAEAIGIVVEAGYRQHVSTAIGPFETYGHEVELGCLGHRVTSTVYFATQYNFPRNVLGRAGWLNHYRLGVIDHDSVLYLSQYNDLLAAHGE